MSCTRKIADHVIGAGNILAPAATIVVMTDIGSVTRSFVPVLAAATPLPFDIPLGTILPFGGTKADAEMQKANGWWICDGRTVDDPQARILRGKPTPSLVRTFLRGSEQAGGTGGAGSVVVGDQVVHTVLSGFEQDNTYGHPSDRIPNGGATFQWMRPMSGNATWKGQTIDTVPPYYGVLYLIRVR
jgi:hypothetical protein